MDLAVEQSGDNFLVKINGDIDTLTSPELQTCLSKAVEQGQHNFIIDMTDVRYISSMGLRVFLSHLKKIKPFGGKMVLCGAGKLVCDVLRMSGFLSYFEMTSDLEGALLKLQLSQTQS